MDVWLKVVHDISSTFAFASLCVIGLCLFFIPIKDFITVIVPRRRELGVVFIIGAAVRLADLAEIYPVGVAFRVASAVVTCLTAAYIIYHLWCVRSRDGL